MIISVLISLFLLISYLMWSYWNYGILTSISETHYYNKKWMFPITIVLCTILVLPYWLEISNENYEFLAFISCAGLIFIGAAPLFKDRDRKIHIGAVYVAGISALIWALLTNWIIPCILIIPMIILILKYKKYWVLIMELSIFTCIYFMLLL